VLPPHVDGRYAVYGGLNGSWWNGITLVGDRRSLVIMQGTISFRGHPLSIQQLRFASRIEFERFESTLTSVNGVAPCWLLTVWNSVNQSVRFTTFRYTIIRSWTMLALQYDVGMEEHHHAPCRVMRASCLQLRTVLLGGKDQTLTRLAFLKTIAGMSSTRE
jgi:hypothetical protein